MIDILAVIVLIYGLYVGYTRGIIKTVFSIVSILVGILAALALSPTAIDIVENIFHFHPALNFLLGFGLTFLLVMMLVRYVGKKLEDFLKLAHVNFVNKVTGAGIMGMILLVLYSYTLYGVDKIGVISQNSKDTSISYSFLNALPQHTESLMEKTMPFFTGFYNKVKETYSKIKAEQKKEQALPK